jgi:hypothetical protein
MSAPRRPRPRSRALIDPSNAYARLGASPLDSTEEIKALILNKRNAVMAKRRGRADQQFGKEEAEVTELQRIEDEIGSSDARTAYDLEHPQNELLTVQQSRRDRVFDRAHRAGLLSAWLVSELGCDVFLPSPSCQELWAPGGIDPALAQALSAFVAEEGRALSQGQFEGQGGDDAPLDVSSLEKTARFAPEISAPDEE